jgi:hypothetical protein
MTTNHPPHAWAGVKGQSMKALTIHAPWAWAIAHGGKDVENRTWPTNYRGPLAIHAGLSTASDRSFLHFLAEMGIKLDLPRDFPRGAILAVADLVDVLELGDDALHDTPWAEGPVCWCLENVRALAKPLPCRGAQGLWTVPTELESLIESYASIRELSSVGDGNPGWLF